MAKVTITIEDSMEEGVSLFAFFEPEPDSEPTMAQCVALSFLAYMNSDEEEDFDPTDLCTDEDEAMLGIGAHAALSEEELL